MKSLSVTFFAFLLLNLSNVQAITFEINSSTVKDSSAPSANPSAQPKEPQQPNQSFLVDTAKPTTNPFIVNQKDSFCLINIFSLHFFYVQVNTLSTQGLGNCSSEDYFKLSPVSVKAQLATSPLKAFRVSLWGIYHPTMDLSNVFINHKYEDIGLLRFYEASVSTFRLSDMLQDPGMISLYLQGANYLPYKSSEDLYYIWNPGSPVYELVDPDGNVYIMTYFTNTLTQSLNIQSLSELGAFLRLPKGWSYRTRVVEKVLEIEVNSRLSNFTTRLSDNYNNIYLKLPK